MFMKIMIGYVLSAEEKQGIVMKDIVTNVQMGNHSVKKSNLLIVFKRNDQRRTFSFRFMD